jgi:alkylhydroperoxidase family enzyme
VSYIEAPARIPLLLRLALSLVERRMGKKLVANRILAWYPKAVVGSGVMEGLIAHDTPEVPRRLLALIRMYTSFLVSCPFCIDLNSRQFEGKGVSEEEVLALQGRIPMENVSSIAPRERAALAYVKCICTTPLSFPSAVIDDMKSHFGERGIVIVASTCAQVNFWARLIQALGVPPAGFTEKCEILNLDGYTTARR